MNGHFTLGSIRANRYFLTIAVSLGLMFAFIGPDQQSSGLSLFLQWQLQTIGPMLLMIGSHLLLHKIGAFARLNPWFKLVASGALGAMLFSPIALILDVGLQGEILSQGRFGALRNLGHEIVNFVPPVVFCWIVINAPWVMGWRFEQVTPDNEPDIPVTTDIEPLAPASLTGLSRLLPAELGDDIMMMKSELHYLLVQTTQGKTMVLYNLKDAVNEQASNTGLQCHRSYWVSHKYIKRLHRAGRQGNIELTDGTLIPVSRGNMEPVRAAIG